MNEIIDIIARAAEKWTNPSYHLRKIAEKAVPAVTGYDADQFSLELKLYSLISKEELKRFVNSELGQSGACWMIFNQIFPVDFKILRTRFNIPNIFR